MKELRKTYLVQRLCKSYGQGATQKLAEAFSFGGGLKNGGLSEDAMKLLRPIFSFDYMGSAEFEFGAIPEFFQHLAQNHKNYIKATLSINKKLVYIICHEEQEEAVKQRLVELSKDKIRCKEYHGFHTELGLNKYTEARVNTIGWIELDNKFMFFLDEGAFYSTAELFGLYKVEKA